MHKYTKILLDLRYEELLNLSDVTLERTSVTLGARGKILKNIALIKERPQRLKELSDAIEEVGRTSDTEQLIRVLRDLETIVLMPLKPYHPQPPSAGASYPVLRRSHDSSGSDSGTEHDFETAAISGGLYLDIPGQIFDLLKAISTEIFVKEYTSHEAVTVFACLLDKCLKREAFSSSQKLLFTAWLSKLKTLWNPPHIKKATDYKKR